MTVSSGLRDLGRLRLFVEAASLGSFSAAADVLEVSQSGASQQIGALERELGVELFDRGHRPVHARGRDQSLFAGLDTSFCSATRCSWRYRAEARRETRIASG